MPKEIRKIAKNHLVNPEEITIKVKTSTADTINQSYCLASGMPHKIDVLTRILEVENFEAVLIFVRTKTATVELSEKLQARGHACAALNGDIAQNQRERIVERLKKGELDILVATDVAARGLDVKRASHVINFDIPYDVESYIHRIGRTGRAGKKGDAILFVAPRERRMLRTIETATRQKIAEMKLPHKKEIKQLRIVQFKERISKAITQDELKFFAELIEQYQQETDTPLTTIAAALAQIAEEKAPLFTQIKEVQTLADKPKPGRQGRRKENGSRRAQKPAKFFGKHGKKKSFSKAKPGKASNKSTRAKRSSNTKRSR
jgi:ATP-dependent RNA helicase DeaD